MQSTVICDVTWSTPATRRDLLSEKIPKTSCVYAMTVGRGADRKMLRLGATADLFKRLGGYKVLDIIPDASVSWSPVSLEFKTALEPVTREYFTQNDTVRPKHLIDKAVEYCVERELRMVEYKAERILLEGYRERHKYLPPGNARTGSSRGYLSGIRVVEHGDFKLLELERANLPPVVSVNSEDLIGLLW